MGAVNVTDPSAGTAQSYSGQGLETFLASLGVSAAIAVIQVSLFLLLRNKLARIYKPKCFLVPDRERTDPPPASPWGLVRALMEYSDRDVIRKCGLDAYFFMRYLKTLLVIFVPLTCIICPILLPINFIGGVGQNLWTNTTTSSDTDIVVGLNTLAWGNVKPKNYERRWAHLILALVVIVWVCFVVFTEMRVFIKVRQDWLTSAEHRLRASANTVLVSSIPEKWLSEEALRGLFDVFPGGIRNIWLTRDFTKLLDKIKERDEINGQLESAESDLIRECKKRQLKKREKEERNTRKELRTKQPTKAERAQRKKDEDAEAQLRAEAEDGISFGEHAEVPHNAGQIVEGMENDKVQPHEPDRPDQPTGFSPGLLGDGLFKLGQGLGQGLKGGANLLEKAGHGVLGGMSAATNGVDNELERTGGFEYIKSEVGSSVPQSPTRDTDGRATPANRRVQIAADAEQSKESFSSERSPAQSESHGSKDSMQQQLQPNPHLNTVRKQENVEDMFIKEKTRWWQFWKPPSGGYASPVPQGTEDKDYFGTHKSIWVTVKEYIPFMGEEEEKFDYPPFVNPGQDEEYQERPDPEWQKWIPKAKDRPHHRLAIFSWTPGWLPGLPLINTKVDTIYWCRKELARLNVEIEEDQKTPERFPVMTSAFIQFNSQMAAHMACQSVIHHVPKQMAPRVVEISPDDVIWDNMAMSWWSQWVRVFIACGFVFGMVILWAIPVAFSASLSQVDTLIQKYHWLGFLKANGAVYSFVKLAAGVLPQILLAVLLALVPVILNLVAEFQGVKTGASKTEWVQTYYFFFLFVQVFLVVSITSGAISTIVQIASDVQSLPTLLAQNLPESSNYFFSYLVLQGASVSSGTVLQVGALAMWYVLSKILDNTARAKFSRQISLPSVSWGSFFPVYTNFACIALVFSVIAPLMSVFAILNFSMLWCAHRYNMLYVTRFKTDTGGVLYPRALNQMFTGLYVMELCLVGLFFLVTNNGQSVCAAQGIIMIVAIFLTALFQIFLNREFGTLLRYLPITFEDEAVLRDRAFQREQDRRMGLIVGEDDEATTLRSIKSDDKDIELQDLGEAEATTPHSNQQQNAAKTHRKNMSSGGGSLRMKFMNPAHAAKSTLKHAGTWAVQSGSTVKHATLGRAEDNIKAAADYRQQRRIQELMAQRAIGEALFGQYADEIEDLTPEERDALVRKAFTHSAVRARRPVVWIPRDDLGVSDDEVRRTNEYSEHIWISNANTALDSKGRAVYGKAPPDFTEVDLIQL